MDRHYLRRYGKMVLSTMGGPAVVFMGNGMEGLNVLRKSAVGWLRTRTNATRDSLASVLSISARAIDEWTRLWRQDGESEEEEFSTEPARFYFHVMQFLQASRGRYVSLGQIGDHVKAKTRTTLETRIVKRRLDTYVDLGFLERAPDDPEKYRLAVEVPTWADRSRKHMETALPSVFQTVFDIGYRLFVGSDDSLVRLADAHIPVDQKRAFLEALKEMERDVDVRIMRLEKELCDRSPDTPRLTLRKVFMASLSHQEENGHWVNSGDQAADRDNKGG